jgi:dienelactone hydrolase
MTTRGRRFRWLWLVAALLLILSVASAYSVRWYHSFYHHVTPQELSHEVRHSTFSAVIRGGPAVEMQLYQQENAKNQPLVLFTSGDGGWSPFCADVAAHIAAKGLTVVGFDAKTYLTTFATPQKPVTAEEITRDYAEVARVALARPGVDERTPLILAGWSLGAGYSVLVASQPDFNHPISRVVAISLPELGELAWRSTDAIIYITHRTPNEKVFDVHQYLKKLDHTPIVFLNATDDDTAPLREAKSLYDSISGAKRFYSVKASGHHFEGGEKEFYQDLDAGVSG